MIKRNPERPQITSLNYDEFSEKEREAASDAWRELALSGENNLEYAYLRGADLQGANLQGADLQDADLRGANLRSADLRGANLKSTNLRSADLRGANLQDACLQGANLYGAKLQGANLQSANLRGAYLYADLDGANLLSADLTAVEYLTDEQIRSARNVIQLKVSEFSEIPEDFRSYEPVNRLFKAQSLRK